MTSSVASSSVPAGMAGLGTGQPIVRPVTGRGAAFLQWGLAHLEILFGLSRACAPILVFKQMAVVTRYDDVKEVFLADEAFAVPYAKKAMITAPGTAHLGRIAA